MWLSVCTGWACSPSTNASASFFRSSCGALIKFTVITPGQDQVGNLSCMQPACSLYNDSEMVKHSGRASQGDGTAFLLC